MLTFTRTIKDGTAVEFTFTQKDNRYDLIDDNISFRFSKYEKFVTFDINTNCMTGRGYGTALISIVLDFASNNGCDFVSGHLSIADYDNKNWEDSIRFYLHQKKDAFLIKTNNDVFMRNLYLQYESTDEFFNDFTHYTSYDDFIAEPSEGHIIYPLVMNQN